MIHPTGDDYLLTPRRRAGMDHDFYAWRDTWAAPRLEWPEGAGLGIWIQLAVEWFPLDMSAAPFLPIGAPARPWPDSETYTQRDYGLRVGIWRLLEALAARRLPASVLLNARVAERYPLLMSQLLGQELELIAAGLDAGAIHHEGLSEESERRMIAETLAIFARFGVAPAVWHSPSWSQSSRTPRLLKEAGLQAMVDWCNDETPYQFDTGAGPIVSLPATLELSDREMIAVHHQRQESFEHALMAAARRLSREAAESGSGRLLTFNVSPWLMGQPYRIATFERLLTQLFALPSTHPVTAAQVMAASQ